MYKGGRKKETNNYHLISFLTCFAKIVEKLICVRFTKFFEKHSVVYPNQYGFLSKISIAHAIQDVATGSYENMQKSLFTGLVLVDVQKTFDISIS